MPTVYQHFLKCEQKQAANQPKIMAGVNAILAKFPNVKHRILPDEKNPASGSNNLVYAVLNMSCDDLSGLAKPGFLGLFSKLGSLGAGLALRNDYVSFLNLIRNPADPATQKVIQQDWEYYKALQASIEYLNDDHDKSEDNNANDISGNGSSNDNSNKNTFCKYLMSIPHVANYLVVIKNELHYINDQLTKICFDQEYKKLAALEQMLTAKSMDAGNSDPIQDIQDMAKIAQDVANLKLLDVYGGTNHKQFAELCTNKVEKKLENHFVTLSQQTDSALGKKSATTQTLQTTVDALRVEQTQLETLKGQFPQKAVGVILNKQSEKIDELVTSLLSKQQELRPFEIMAARKAAEQQAEQKMQMKVENQSQRGRDVPIETRGRSHAVVGRS